MYRDSRLSGDGVEALRRLGEIADTGAELDPALPNSRRVLPRQVPREEPLPMTQAHIIATGPDLPLSGRVDIAKRDDILELLRDFYGRAFRDELLGPVFVDVADMDLDAHLPVIADFWDTVLFHSGSYRRNALAPHQRLHALVPLTPAHFAQWLALWTSTVDDRHAGPKAELAKLQGRRIAGAMSRRLTRHGRPCSSRERPSRSGRRTA